MCYQTLCQHWVLLPELPPPVAVREAQGAAPCSHPVPSVAGLRRVPQRVLSLLSRSSGQPDPILGQLLPSLV